jgi:hypothetical protein
MEISIVLTKLTLDYNALMYFILLTKLALGYSAITYFMLQLPQWLREWGLYECEDVAKFILPLIRLAYQVSKYLVFVYLGMQFMRSVYLVMLYVGLVPTV